jgi:hypothetical protein
MTNVTFLDDVRRRMYGTSDSVVPLTMYLDASGRDDWADTAPWYIIASALVRSSHRWKQCRTFIRSLPGGHFHASGRRDRHGPSTHDLVKQIIAFRAQEHAMIYVVHRASVAASDSDVIKNNPYSCSEWLWSHVIATTIRIQQDHGAGAHVSRIVMNHPARSAKGVDAITSMVREWLPDRIPVESRPGKDPGIGLVDALAWGTHRFLNRGDRYPFEDPNPDGLPRLSWYVMKDGITTPVRTLDQLQKITAGVVAPAVGKVSSG